MGPPKNSKWAPKKKQNGRQKFSFSQLSPQQLTNVIYSKNKKTLSTLPEHFEKKNHQNRIIFEGVMALAINHVICQKCVFR